VGLLIAMKPSLNEVKGRRYRLTGVLGNSYLFVSQYDVMLTVAEENNPKNAQLRAMGEAVCRLASKGLATGMLTLKEIADQWRKADSGRCQILSDMATCLDDFVLTRGQRDRAGVNNNPACTSAVEEH